VFSTLSAGNQLNQATGAANEPVQVVPLEAEDVQYVRFEIETNWGAAGIVGLSEVRFERFTPQPRDLTWNGEPGNAAWDTVSTNWLAEGLPAVFRHGDNARFDDAAAEKTVKIGENLIVGTLLFDTEGTYRLSCGTDTGKRIAAATSFVKHGSGILELDGGNTQLPGSYHAFTNDILIEAGTVRSVSQGMGLVPLPPAGLFGNMNVPRQLTVTNGAVLCLGANNALGGAMTATQTRLMIVDGSVLTNAPNTCNTLGPAVFDNAVIAPLRDPPPGTWPALVFNGDAAFRGTVPYTLASADGAALGFGYVSPPSLHVEDITGDALPDVTFNARIIDFPPSPSMPSRFRKTGPGTLRLGSTDSSFTGGVTVAEGVLEAASGVASNKSTSALGNPKIPRTIRVERGATLRFSGSNTIATGFDSPLMEVEIAGGTLALANGSSSVFGPLTLDDAVVTYANGYGASTWGMMIFTKSVTFKGTQPAAFNPVGTLNNFACGLNEETEIRVDDVTGTPAVDAALNLPFINFGQITNTPPSRFVKTGPGTLSLGAANVSTGALRVAEGVLRIDGSWSAANSSVTAESGGWLGGTGTVARAVFAGGGFECAADQDGPLTAAAVTVGETGTVRILNPSGLPLTQCRVPFLAYAALEGKENLTGWTVEIEGVAQTANLRVFAKDGRLVAGWAPRGTMIRLQ
jgi:autotransporter-associated beta strand protein